MVEAIYRATGAIANERPTENSNDPVIFNDWYVVATIEDLTPGTLRPLRLLGKDLVIWRGTDTTIQVWEDRCPHRSVQFSRGTVVENTLVCAYHGMAYNSEGRCIQVPAHPTYVPPKQACARTYPVQERYGLVFVCLGHSTADIVDFPEWENSSFVCGVSGPHPCQTGGYRAIENFLDIAHFPFVHTNILGDPAKTPVEDYQIAVDDQGVHIPHVQVWQPNPLGTGTGAYVAYTYSVFRPLTAYLRKESPNGEQLSILYCVTPVSEEECVGWMLIAMNFIDAHQLAEALAFQDGVVAQDVANLESHTLKKLPLSMQAEFHVPCDRASLAYRKWLKQQGVTYGVIQ